MLSSASTFELAPSIVHDGPDSSSVTIHDAHFLFHAEFKRSGSDLTLTGEDGHKVIVADYFKHDKLPTLLSPEGAALTGDIVEALVGPRAAGQYAQAGAPVAAPEIIGRVATASGGTTAVRNGAAVTLNQGDAIYKGDVIQTAADSAIGVVFTDGTTFNLTSNARMVLNEFVYNPGGSANSSLFNLVQGSITFLAGEVAHTGDMKVGTPTATMGIRGTAVQVDIDVNNGQVKMSVLVEPGNRVGSFNVYSLNGTLLGTVNNAGLATVVTPAGPQQATITELQKSPAELAQALVVVQQIVQTQAVGAVLNAANPPPPAGPNTPNNPPGTGPNAPTPPTTDPNTQTTKVVGSQVSVTVDPTKVIKVAVVATPTDVKIVDVVVQPQPVAPPPAPPAPPAPQVLPPPPEVKPILIVDTNHAPSVSVPALSVSTFKNTPINLVGAHVADPDAGDILTVTVHVAHGTLTPLSVGAGLISHSGEGTNTLTITGLAAAIDAAVNAGVTYTPAAGFIGADQIVVTATDNHGASDTKQEAINVVANSHFQVGTDVFLQGAFMEIGVSGSGSLGSANNAPAGFHPTGGRGNISFLGNPDGFASATKPIAGDVTLPGSPVDGISVGFNGTTTFANDERVGLRGIATTTTDTSSGGLLSAHTVGVAGSVLQLQQDITLDPLATFFTTTVTLTNTSGSPLSAVRFMRSFDPDIDFDNGRTFSTLNDVLANPNVSGSIAIASATGPVSGQAYQLIALDPLARASNFGFQNDNPYNPAAFNSPIDLNGALVDQAISLTFDVGSLAPGASRTVTYFTSMNVAGASNGMIVGNPGGHSTLTGGPGNDTIFAIGGNNTLTGGAGDDRFVFTPGNGANTITDFQAGPGTVDELVLVNFSSVRNFSQALAAATDGANGVTINLGGGDSVTLNGVNHTQLSSNDFIFVGNASPTLTGGLAVNLVKGAGVVLTTKNIQAIDPDNTPSQLTYTVVNSNHEHVVLNTTPLAVGGQFTEAQLELGLVSLVADDASYTGKASLTVSVSDGVAGSTPATATIDSTIFDLQFNVLTAAGFDSERGKFLVEMGAGTVQPAKSATGFTIVNASADLDFVFRGTGFTYSLDGSTITGGTITSILGLTHIAQQQLFSVTSNVSAADWYNAIVAKAAGNDAPLDALTAGFTFNSIGGPGPDRLGSSEGNDRFAGNGGNDVLNGGGGLDRAVYANATGPINVQLAAGTVTGDASVGTDTLRSIEFVTGSSFADTFNAAGFGPTSINAGSIVPGAGSTGTFNEFEGLGGNDVIIGNGNTRISYLHATAGVTVDLAAGTAQGDASVGNDTFTNVNAVRGSNFADTLLGSNNPVGTSENFEGAGGNDFIDGRGGFDRAIYKNAFSGINVQLAAGIVTGGPDTGTDTLRSIEAILGTNFADVYDATGFTATSTNAGSAGVNNSGAAFNEFEGGGGNDTVIGNGNTQVSFFSATGGVVASLGSSGSGTATGNLSVGTDTFISGVNALKGSAFNDILIGNAGNNTLIGAGGNDVLNGLGGNNTLTGGTGSDIFVYRASSSVFDANSPASHNDTITDFSHSDGDRIDLRGDAGINNLADLLTHDASPGGGSDIVLNFLGVGGATDPSSLTIKGVLAAGQTAAQFLQASDFIFNGQVAITVQTPAGYDFSTLYDDMAASDPNQAANDSTHVFAVDATKGITFEMVGSGFTYASGSNIPVSGVVNEIDILNTANTSQTTQDHVLVNSTGWNDISVVGLFSAIGEYRGVETHGLGVTHLNAIFNAQSYSAVGSAGSQANNNGSPLSGADVFVSSDHADVFNGLGGPFGPFDPGNDTVAYINAGPVIVSGTIVTSTGVTVDLATPSNNAGINAVGDTYISIENLRGSNFNDILRGDGNNNVLEGGLGNDTLDGRGGYDTASYEHATGGVTVDLNNPNPQNTGADGTDLLISIEALRGSSFNDTLTGNGGGGVFNFNGFPSGSMLEGGPGADHLISPGGNDIASYEHAAAGVTVNLANPGLNTGDAAGDTYSNIHNLFGSAFADHLTGDNSNNILNGGFGSGNGSGGGDVLTGLGGADTFVFNGGQTTITDFTASQGDKVDLQGSTFFLDTAHVQALINATTGNTIQFGDSSDHNILTFSNIANVSTQLHLSDFIVHNGAFV